MQSSRVGLRIRNWGWRVRGTARCSMGRPNAAVLPEPVLARAMQSRSPPISCGIISAWIGMGVWNPSASTARSNSGLRPNFSKLMFSYGFSVTVQSTLTGSSPA